MAWPISPLTTYIANSVPVIKAADLNSIQDAINKTLFGTYSFRSVRIDGTGGASFSPIAGALDISIQSAASSQSPGRIFKNNQIAAYGYLSFDGITTYTLQASHGLPSIFPFVRNSAGKLSFAILPNMSNDKYPVTVTPADSTVGFTSSVLNKTTGGFEVYLFAAMGTNTTADTAFSFIVSGS